jgi:hypothetical protein
VAVQEVLTAVSVDDVEVVVADMEHGQALIEGSGELTGAYDGCNVRMMVWVRQMPGAEYVCRVADPCVAAAKERHIDGRDWAVFHRECQQNMGLKRGRRRRNQLTVDVLSAEKDTGRSLYSVRVSLVESDLDPWRSAPEA